jgi:hypothetical protein
LSGPTIVCGAEVVVVPPCWSCAVAVVVVLAVVVVVAVLDGAIVPLCPELVVFVAGAELVVELPFFFAFAFVVGVVCAVAIEPAARNALTQKLAANFRYPFISRPLKELLLNHFQYTHPSAPGRYNFSVTQPRSCGPPHAVIQTMYSSLLRQI